MQPKSSDTTLRVFVSQPATYTVSGSRAEGEPPVAHPCRTRSIALDRIVIEAAEAPPLDAKVYLNIPGLGISVGQVSRRLSNGFVVALDLEGTAKLMPRLDWLKRHLAREADNRRAHPRYMLPPYGVRLTAGDGTIIKARLLDLSASGLAVETRARAVVGTRLTLGAITGEVARLFDGGLAIAFEARRLDDLRRLLFPEPGQ